MTDRSKFIGGTDAMRIMRGEWAELYAEKKGLVETEDLSSVFPVQLGIFTEPFHLSWVQDSLGPINQKVESKYHPLFTYMRAHIDGWCEDHNTFIEAKHTGGFEDLNTLIDRYTPQLAHYCNVYQREWCWFSVIMGNREPTPVKVSIDAAYRENLITVIEQFWWHVTEGVEPEITPVANLDVKAQVKVNDMRVVDMTGNNEWAHAAQGYRMYEEQAKEFESCKKMLKRLVEDDVRQATGHGITVKRAVNGSLRISAVQDRK